MKKKLLSIGALLLASVAHAQVGIGTLIPNRSAVLTLASNDKGLLISTIPLKSTTDNTSIVNGNVESLLVYANVKQGDIIPGFYYWDKMRWVRIIADVDIANEVIKNFQTIINNTEVKKLLTEMIKEEAGNVRFDGSNFSYEDETGVHSIDFEALVKANETVTTLVKDASNNGKYVYTNEDGATVTIDVVEDVGNNFDAIVKDDRVDTILKKFIINSNTLVKTAVDYVVLDLDTTVVVDADTADLTVTIPAAAPANEGRIIAIRKIDESDHTLSFSQQIKVSKTQNFNSLNYPATLRIQSDGVYWYLID